jgi:hypothetical protein
MKNIRIKFNKNILIINDKSIVFENNIKEIQKTKDKIFVLIDSSTGSEFTNNDLNNVRCYSYNAELIWQLKRPSIKEKPEFGKSTIIAIDYDNQKNEFFATDFMTRRFRVNMNTGELLDFTVTK